MTEQVAEEVRPLWQIAAEIRRTWKTLPTAGYAAVPYVYAMERLDGIDGMYYADSARSIVQYFLANATAWRGEDARRVKAELKSMLKRR